MKTQRELNLKYWGRVHDMCTAYNEKHGTDVKPWRCVKVHGICAYEFHPNFYGNPEAFELAVAILEGKPVFVGDALYNGHGAYLKVTENCGFIFENMSWTPPAPKRTFMLNGIELPCPKKVDFFNEDILIIQVEDKIRHFGFKSTSEALKVYEIISDLLTKARDS